MIQNISLKNFRGFRTQEFSFADINVFVGPNSSGKSSAISAINLIAQTVTNPDNTIPLVLNGQYEDLGSYLDVVHGHRSNTPISISFSTGGYDLSIEWKYRKQRREIEISEFDLHRQGSRIYQVKFRKDAYDLFYGNRRFETWLPDVAKRRPRFRSLVPLDFGLQQATYGLISSNNERSRAISKALNETSQKTLRDYSTQINGARRRILDEFSSYDALSSFRDVPQRTYVYSGGISQSVGRTGSNAVEILVNDASKRGAQQLGLLASVSKWFKATGISRGITVKPLTSRHFEICMIGHDGGEHNICDVGFGCSQVLPVLIGGLFVTLGAAGVGQIKRPGRSPTFVVQEPEIHLHPNAQAELGTFFVDLAHKGCQLFVETHSDNLCLRLASHVADGSLHPDQIKFFYLRSSQGRNVVSELSVGDDGTFRKEWPGGFFPQRQQESLNLARASVAKSDPRQYEFKYIGD